MAWFGPWSCLPPQDTSAQVGDPPAVSVQSSRCSGFTCSMSWLEGAPVGSWVPSCPCLCPPCASAPRLLRSARAALLPQVCPQVTRVSSSSGIPQRKGSGWQDVPRSWCHGTAGTGRIEPSSEERLQHLCTVLTHCVFVQLLQLQHRRPPCSWQGLSAQRLS